MADLTPAHRGYEYQDLLVACRLVDMLLDTVTEAHVDKKLVESDRCDDLTVKDASGRWERSQFKGSPQNYLCDTGRVVIKAEVAGCDAVVPVRVELVRSDDLGCQVLDLLVCDLDAGRVAAGVQLGLYPKPGAGGGGADGLQDHLVALQRAAPPVHRDRPKHPVLDFVPLARAL